MLSKRLVSMALTQPPTLLLLKAHGMKQLQALNIHTAGVQVEPHVMRQRTTDPGMPWGQIVSVSWKPDEGRIPGSVGPGSPRET